MPEIGKTTLTLHAAVYWKPKGKTKAAARWVPERQVCKLKYRVTGTAAVLDIVSEMRLNQKRGERCLTD